MMSFASRSLESHEHVAVDGLIEREPVDRRVVGDHDRAVEMVESAGERFLEESDVGIQAIEVGGVSAALTVELVTGRLLEFEHVEPLSGELDGTVAVLVAVALDGLQLGFESLGLDVSGDELVDGGVVDS